MDFFFVEYRDPIVGLIILTILIFVVAVGHYFYRIYASRGEEKGLGNFIKKFEIESEHKALLRASSLNLNSLHFLGSVFSKSGEFEKAVQIYLIALEKTKSKDEQELIFYDLAEVYFKAGFLQKSAEVLLNALKNRPRNIKALKLLKLVYLRLRKFDEVLYTLDSLFELGLEVSKERAFIKALKLQNLPQNLNQKIDQRAELSLQLDENNDIIKRFVFEQYKVSVHGDFKLFIDLLYKSKTPIFLEDEAYFEFFCALGLCKPATKHKFKDKKLQMLQILKDNDFKAKLSFSFVCLSCKTTMPLFFYHCPLCYEFAQCKILYEVRSDEED
ncbi:tetratricopeptide repeat protein [Campylobacter sp. MIT 97-5078]|uniref:tetratricopeptide repeat protein n=1 Tax=Campylobacter sp. MIT 97-5078 TaxID=1548153 RepID=UPI0005135DE7|nr:tetratricopeptide repeat protein [Campylobacter sp. MIT 97-5078]KGI56282.1 hypothetical protein LR59_08100 [Campylobacter sp. MIT 97-5078]TQR27789.1 tetratricopeptide repeat protein [Campylobacter sp. MIT 97-5078]